MILGKSQRDKDMTRVSSVAPFKDGKLLWGKRQDNDKWTLPGGHLNPNESPEKGAVRELLEETGLKPSSLEFLGSAEVPGKNMVVYSFKAEVDGDPDSSLDPDGEISEFKWVDPDSIPDEIMDNLHSPKNVTLQLLELQEVTLDLKLEKSIAGALMGLAVGAATLSPIIKWTPNGLNPELHPIAHLESNFGQNTKHVAHSGGTFHTAHGAVGLKPITGHEEYLKSKVLQRNFPGLQDKGAFEKEFKNNHSLYNLVASTHWARLKKVLGTPERTAYGWRFGLTAAKNASDKDIAGSPYVGKYLNMMKSEDLIKDENELDPNLTDYQLKTIIFNNELGVGMRRKALSHPNLSPATILDIVKDKDITMLGNMWDSLFANPNFNEPVAQQTMEFLNERMLHTDHGLQYLNTEKYRRILQSPNITSSNLMWFLENKPIDNVVPDSLIVENPKLSDKDLRYLYNKETENNEIKYYVTSNPNVPSDILEDSYKNAIEDRIPKNYYANSRDLMSQVLKHPNTPSYIINNSIENSRDEDNIYDVSFNPGISQEQISKMADVLHEILPHGNVGEKGRRIFQGLIKKTTDPNVLDKFLDSDIPIVQRFAVKFGKLTSHQVDRKIEDPNIDPYLLKFLSQTADDKQNHKIIDRIANFSNEDQKNQSLLELFSDNTNNRLKVEHFNQVVDNPKFDNYSMKSLVNWIEQDTRSPRDFDDETNSNRQIVENVPEETISKIINRPFETKGEEREMLKEVGQAFPKRLNDSHISKIIESLGSTDVPYDDETDPYNPHDSWRLVDLLERTRELKREINLKSHHIDTLLKHSNPKVRFEAISHPNASYEQIMSLANDPDRNIRGFMHQINPDGSYKESVGVKLGVSKHRLVRDMIEGKGVKELSPKQLPPGDWSVGRLPNGNISSDKLQQHIDSILPMKYNVSHGEWDGGQQHTHEPSNVFQLNLTSSHIKQLSEAGVLGTFRKMHEASVRSGHPVDADHGIGWVRWTGNPERRSQLPSDDGIFIDEVQSDFGQSFVRQAAAQAAQSGGDVEEAAKRAEEKYPEEHFKKISKILFNGKHPNEILSEAFHQWLRDTNNPNTVVNIHTVESKAPISLGKRIKNRLDAPGHFNVTYHDVPKKMGKEPDSYGKLQTESNEGMKGQPIWSGLVRKSMESLSKALAVGWKPAFKNTVNNEIVVSPVFHNIDLLPNGDFTDDWVDGFVNPEGKFYNREETYAQTGATDSHQIRESNPSTIDINKAEGIPVKHYSIKEDLSELDPKFQGTGHASMERNRPNRVPRVYLYTQKGTPESKLANSGTHLYHGELPKGTKLYDMSTDEHDLLAPKYVKSKYGTMYKAPDLDDMERKLVRLGYHGYYNYGVKDAIAYFHKLPVQKVKKSEKDEIYEWLAKASETKEGSGLAVLHNLTGPNVLHAHKMGGLPAPSIAVAAHDHPLTGYGEITLVGSKDLVDPQKGTPVFGSDIYSPRWPKVKHAINGRKFDEFIKNFTPFFKATGNYLGDFDQEFSNRGPDKILNERRFETPMMLGYLKEKGHEIVPPMIPARLQHDFVAQPAMQDFKNKYGIKHGFEFQDDYHRALSEATIKSVESKFNSNPELDENDKRSLIGTYKDTFIGDDGFVHFGNTGSILKSLERHGTQEVDQYAFEDAIKSKVRELGIDNFNKWAMDKLNPLSAKTYISRYTESGNERKIPYTLENVLKEMTRKVRQGEGFNYGLGSARAGGSKKFKSIDDIKKARSKIVSHEDFQKAKKEIDDSFGKLVDKLAPYHQSGGMAIMESLSNAIGESYKHGKSLWKELKLCGFDNITPELHRKVADFAKDLLAMPTEYFEAKPQRIVGFQEFNGAAVPHNVSPEVVDALKRHGLDIETYTHGDESARTAAIKRLVHSNNLELSELKFNKSEDNLDNEDISETAQDMVGFHGHVSSVFQAAKFLAGGRDLSYEEIRDALLNHEDDIEMAAIYAYGLPESDSTRRALRAIMDLHDFNKSEVTVPQDIRAGTPEAQDVAQAIARAFSSGEVNQIKLTGKHSKGSMLIKDPQTKEVWLLKSGSGKQSPAAGVDEEPSTQSRRESAFYHISEIMGLQQSIPEAQLVIIDNKEWAAIRMLPYTFKNLDKVKKAQPSTVIRSLAKYRDSGLLHKWAVLDALCAQSDRHGNNLMIEPETGNVALIDHGSAFAGNSFDPAYDKNSFVPYYLRAWSSGDFIHLSLKDKLSIMPTVSEPVREELYDWFNNIDGSKIESVLINFGIDPRPTLNRLAKLKMLFSQYPIDIGINRFWVTT